MKTRLKTLKYLPLHAGIAALACLLAVFPERYVPVCFEGLALWARCVVPALFPFMVITMLFIGTGGAERAARPFGRVCSVFGLPAEAAVIFIMSVFSGYPAGSRIICEYRERGAITEADARRLAPLCSTSGPLFLTGSVGLNMFGDKAAGALIMAAHVTSVLAVGLAVCLYSRGGRSETMPPERREDGNILYDAFCSAVISVAVAGGFICFFYTLAHAAEDLGLLQLPAAALAPLLGECAGPLCGGLIEATGGCAALAASGGRYALPSAGFLVTFGGFSILAQQLCYLGKCGVRPLRFILAKFAQGVLCFVLLLPLT